MSNLSTNRQSTQHNTKAHLISDISLSNGASLQRAFAQLPTKQPSLNLSTNSPTNAAQSPSITYRSFPGNKLSGKGGFINVPLPSKIIHKKNQEHFTKTKLINTANSSFVQAWSSSTANLPESLSDNTQINYGPTISTANSNGSLSNYVINSVSNNANNSKTFFSNGLVSSNSNGNTYRGSGSTISTKQSRENESSPNNIHLTLPSHINNLTIQNNNKVNQNNHNENGLFTQFIDPINESNSNNTEKLSKNSSDDNKKLGTESLV